MLRNENITSQVTGSTDTFTTTYEFEPETLSLGYNGQLFPAGVNIKAILGPTSFSLDFTPETNTTSLSVIYETKTPGDSDSLIGRSHPPRIT